MILPKSATGCPALLLAPMEGIGDRPYRKAMCQVGGFDQATTEFIRVPSNAHIPSLVKAYNANDTAPIPQAAQIMGSDPALMGEMTAALAARGAPRIEINCGCPSNTVTGRGAGSSLLKDPSWLYAVTKEMVRCSPVPVSAKLRSGFEDTTLFEENLLAAQESGISFLTLHPRTKREGYGPAANWDLIAHAVELLDIPVVGNGDILTVGDALRMQEQTHCQALMIGRGAVINPWIFHDIQNYYGNKKQCNLITVEEFLRYYMRAFPENTPEKSRINKLKQLCRFLFTKTELLKEKRREMLRAAYTTSEEFLQINASLFEIYSASSSFIDCHIQ